MTPLELLAPARNADIGIAAIDCGADAVYIAGPDFGARKDAANPVGEIRRLCDYAHKFGARIFVTFNILLRDEEMDEVHSQMLAAQEAGADAFIIRDERICQWKDIRVPLHASTQCAIRTPERARHFAEAGCSRIILERELSIGQIREICAAVSCEVECFVHGALCVCYSGECRLSERLTGRSADRGECIQACRNRFDLVDGNGKVIVRNKALLSLKDLNLSGRLEELIDAGVSSFKIEGRLKNASYVKNTVRHYDLKLREITGRRPELSRASFGTVEGGFTPAVEKTFNRGFTELFYEGKRGQWASMDTPKSMGEKIGTASSVKPSPRGVEIKLNTIGNVILKNGDGFAYVGKGNEILGFRGDVCEGCTIISSNASGIRVGDVVYRNLSVDFEKEIERNACKRLIAVDVEYKVGDGGLQFFATSEDGRKAGVFVPAGDEARNPEKMKDTIAAQISKTAGDYSFRVMSTECQDPAEKTPFVSISALNGARRALAEELDGQKVHCKPLSSAERPSKAGSQKAGYGDRDVLMRTKYCIRHELGLCPKKTAAKYEKHYLLNNGRFFELTFDCRNCEMLVKEANPVQR